MPVRFAALILLVGSRVSGLIRVSGVGFADFNGPCNLNLKWCLDSAVRRLSGLCSGASRVCLTLFTKVQV